MPRKPCWTAYPKKRAPSIACWARANRALFATTTDNPLVLDCVVIDEASMIDLPLMAQLLDALPEKITSHPAG